MHQAEPRDQSQVRGETRKKKCFDFFVSFFCCLLVVEDVFPLTVKDVCVCVCLLYGLTKNAHSKVA